MKTNFLKFVFYFFLVFFFAILLAEKTGYYVPKSTKTKILTEEQIKIFEEDIRNGKEIDVANYTTNLHKDYANELSNTIYRTSLKLETIFDRMIRLIFNHIEDSLD